MILRIFIAILCLFVLVPGLYLIPGGSDLEELIPANIGGVVLIDRPFALFQKTAESGIARDFHRIKSMAKFFESVDQLLQAKRHFPLFSLFVSQVALTVPADLTLFKEETLPVNAYVKVGRGLKILKLLGMEKALAEGRQVMHYRGYRVLTKEGMAMAFVGGFLVTGSEDGVINAILCEKNSIESLAKKNEKRKPAWALLDDKADLSVLLFADSWIRALPWPFDPRFLIDADALFIAGGNLFLERDRVQLDMTMLQKEGRLLLPNTLDKPAEFALTRFLQDDQYLAAGVRLETTGPLADPVFSLFSNGTESKLKEKIIRLAMAHLLEALGPEVGMIEPVHHKQSSAAFLFQIRDRQKLEQSLSKFQREARDAADKLSSLVGQSIDALLGQPDQLSALIDKLPQEDRSKARAWIDEMTDAAKAKGEVLLSGLPLHFEIMGDFFVLSRYPWVLDRIRTASESAVTTSKTREVLGHVDSNGSMFLVVDLLEYLKGAGLIEGKEVLPILQRHSWKSALSLQGGGSRTNFKASVAVDLGTADVDTRPGAGLVIAYYLVLLFAAAIFLAAAWGLVRSVRWIVSNR